MLQPRPSNLSHEDIFIKRYEELRSWALRLAENDREKAEDIVQEAFIHFTLARPDLHAISNLDGYLYNVLRNLHLSQERRASRSRLRQLSIFEYDTLELALHAVGSMERLQVQDDLRGVCHYSCVRKETARTASILILRFFHGYYPSEIARIVQASRRAVDERLRIARNEARLYLDAPTRLRFIGNSTAQEFTRNDKPAETRDLLSELRQMIFNSRRGECLTRAELEQMHLHGDGSQISTSHLAHIVSCRACLEAINSLLGISSLNERHPPDMIGKDSPPKRKGSRGPGRGGKGGSHLESFNKYRRRTREVYEHRPQELYFLVNGFILGSQKITSELNEQTLDISLAEGVSFVEVCSEQDVRLFFFNIEPPPQGDVRQLARMELSDGRSLELKLTFDDKWPTLSTSYHDPLMKAGDFNEEAAEESPEQEAFEKASVASLSQRASVWGRLATFAKHARRRAMFASTWLRPSFVTTLIALLLIAAAVFVKMRAPGMSAAELLQSSIAAEEKRAGNTDLVFHRKVRFEEWGDDGRRLIARNLIEVWHSPARELKVCRIFDEQGKLISGEWIRSDGASTVYHHGTVPQERPSPSVVAAALLETGEIWRLELSAKDFSALVTDREGITVREDSDSLFIEYRGSKTDDASRLVAATLRLRKGNLSAIEQRLVVERQGERREYRFSEELFEKYPKSYIGRSFFIPDAELLDPSDKKESGESQSQYDAYRSAPTPAPRASNVMASPELEVEVTYLINRIKANLGEQVSMMRTTGGTLRVVALVETEGRKEEILRALSPLNGNPAVEVEVRTVGEALKNQPGQPPKPEITDREVVVSNNRPPAYDALRAYFSQRVVGDKSIDEEINRYSNRVMTRSRQALLRASALKQLAGRFSPEEVKALAPEARAKWLAMIREHTLGYRREVTALRQDLRSVFKVDDEGQPELEGDADIRQLAERLLRLSYANDEAVRAAFAISARGGGTKSAIKSPQFWRQLLTAERLSAAIQDAYQR